MAKGTAVICVCTLLLLVGVFTFGNKTMTRRVGANTPRPEHASDAHSSVPDYVVYGVMFAKVVRLREKTRELQTKGRVGLNGYFPLQREVTLTQGQATVLEAIATSCQQKVRQQDERAKLIVNAFRAQFVGGRVPVSGAPPPPPELKVMWQERNDIILGARDQLRDALGQQEFTRFDNYVKFHYGSNTSPVTIRGVEATHKQNGAPIDGLTEREPR